MNFLPLGDSHNRKLLWQWSCDIPPPIFTSLPWQSCWLSWIQQVRRKEGGWGHSRRWAGCGQGGRASCSLCPFCRLQWERVSTGHRGSQKTVGASLSAQSLGQVGSQDRMFSNLPSWELLAGPAEVPPRLINWARISRASSKMWGYQEDPLFFLHPKLNAMGMRQLQHEEGRRWKDLDTKLGPHLHIQNWDCLSWKVDQAVEGSSTWTWLILAALI